MWLHRPGFQSTTGAGIVRLPDRAQSVFYTPLPTHETVLNLVCRLMLEKKTPY